MKKSAHGFTLIELLVVIAIMGIVGTFALANYRNFGADQNLKNASLDIQSLLRQAQTNATANVFCSTGSGGARWEITFGTAIATNVSMNCQHSLPSVTPTPIIKKTLVMPADIQIQGLTAANCPAPATISFVPVTGKVEFLNSAGQVVTNCVSLIVTLQDTKTQSTKSFYIEQGGSIHE